LNVLEIQQDPTTGCGQTQYRHVWRGHHGTTRPQWSWQNYHNDDANWLAPMCLYQKIFT